MNRLSILGGGSWGTALAIVLSTRFEEISLWIRRADLAAAVHQSRENQEYLPGFPLPPKVKITSSLEDCLSGTDLLLSVLPSHAVRETFGQIKNFAPSALPVVSATKGLEAGTLLRISEVIRDAGGFSEIAVLSGPSFAREAAAGLPTAVVVASLHAELASSLQAALSGDLFRVYTSADPVGVELGGAYKNVVAIGAGVCHGLGLGHNSIAALVTRGLAEMTRLAVAAGGRAETLAGLAGLGDLVLTCTGNLSRNRHLGEQLAAGRTLPDILGSTRMVAEGVGATRSLLELGREFHVDLPIVTQMNAVLHNGRPPQVAIRLLMERALRNE